MRTAQARLGRAAGAVVTSTFVLGWLPIVLAVAAAWVFFLQPWPEQVERDALIAIAGIVGLVLSLGFTVTLLIAQHTAERHARILYKEFRREKAWRRVLAWLAFGVAAIVAGALAFPTVSTGWASLLLAMALGLYAVTQLPSSLTALTRPSWPSASHTAQSSVWAPLGGTRSGAGLSQPCSWWRRTVSTRRAGWRSKAYPATTRTWCGR